MKDYELIDTHCHLYLEELAADLQAVMTRAEEEGVTRIYMPGLDNDHLNAMAETEKKYPGKCFSMIGLHPCYVRENYRQELDLMKEALKTRSYAAIGEIGLDYYWDRNFDDQQMICFKEQIGIAKQHSLPIVIHSRNAMEATIGVLQAEKEGKLRGIFHCFSGNLKEAMEIISCGLYLGIGGVVTYKNAGLAEVVAELPLEHIVLETDAPYLTPVPFRGKRNESSYLRYIVAKVAEVKNISIAEVANITARNARAVFG